MVVPFVIVHGEQQVIARISKEPNIFRLETPLDIAYRSEKESGIGDDAAARLEQDCYPLEEMFSSGFARGFPSSQC